MKWWFEAPAADYYLAFRKISSRVCQPFFVKKENSLRITVENSISSDIPRSTLRLVSKIDYGFDQWWVVSFVIKKLFVYLFMVKECIYLVMQMYFMQIYFYFLWFGNKFTDFFVFPKFLLTIHTRWNIKRSKILRKSKTQFEDSQLKSDYEQQTFVP